MTLVCVVVMKCVCKCMPNFPKLLFLFCVIDLLSLMMLNTGRI